MNVESLWRRNQTPKELDRVLFLRGGSVAVLMISRPKDAPHERFVIMTEQPHVVPCFSRYLLACWTMQRK
jgi:ADP-sugar diphosphatase